MPNAFYDITDIIEWGKLSQAYAYYGEAKRKAINASDVDEDLHIKIYLARKSVEWEYAQNPTSALLYNLGNYLYSLCGQYVFEAQNATGGTGGVVATITSTSTAFGQHYLYIKSADFANATDYVNSDLNGYTFRLDGNWIARYLYPPGSSSPEWEYLAGGGFRILIPGFDSGVADYEIYLDPQILDVPDALDITNYNLSAITVITNLAAGNDGDQKSVVIKPNGFAYTWGTTFAFSATWPEQPTAIGVNTYQIYRFQYTANLAKWVCTGQSINIPA